MIANGILYRHWYHPGVNKPWLALFIMLYFTAISLGERSSAHSTLLSAARAQTAVLLALAAEWFATMFGEVVRSPGHERC